uniref:Sarcocystatin-A-like n=1 Tax=Drosophila rhopaloa TaxID=1041015 RepID=A0A6P4FKW7_DRORH
MFVAKILLLCTACVLVSAAPQRFRDFGAFGAPRAFEEDDLAKAQEVLQASLTKLDAGEGPHYRISQILSARAPLASGTLNTYSVELIDSFGATKVCDVLIWSRPWMPNGIRVTFECPNEPKVVRNHSA